MTETCPLCSSKGESVVISNDDYRIIRVEDPDFPGYFRIIWNAHVKEMSDLPREKRELLWEALNQVEKAMIRTMHPEKINLAEFGTMVPHLHWHLIARYSDDAAFPDSCWSPKKRVTSEEVLAERKLLADRCEEMIKDVLS